MTETVRTFELPGIGTKTYRFPTHLDQVELIGAPAIISAASARNWMPLGLTPVRLPGGGAVALFSVQHFGRPAELSPYDEATFAVLAKTADGKRGFHVLSMPVTSRENLARGHVIFGLPKVLAEVSLADEGSARRGEVSIDGEPFFSIRVRAPLPLPVRAPVRLANLQLLNGDWVSVRTRGAARMSLGVASVTVGSAMQQRFPGVDDRVSTLGAFRLTDGNLRLDLPQKM